MSLKHPLENFKKEPPDLRMKQERSDSPTVSCVSLKSMDPPEHFKQEFMPDTSDLTSSVLTKDHFRCSVCTEVLKDPVSIPCGHSYCRQCISSYWAQPNHAGLYACPQCSHTYSSCPALYTNSALAAVVNKLQHLSPVLPADCYACTGDVACDFCTGRKLRAVKTCVTCMASYCESHVRQHYTVPALQKHTLVEPQIQELKLSQLQDLNIEDYIKPLSLLDDLKKEDLEWFKDEDLSEWPDEDQGTLDQRLKQERSNSPVPSCVSLKSMDPPEHFGGESSPYDSREKLKRTESPAPSCVSLKSMDPPEHFIRDLPLDSRLKQERSNSPVPSCVSLKSMDPPEHFKGEYTPFDSSCLSVKSMDPPEHFKGDLTPDSRLKIEKKESTDCPIPLKRPKLEMPESPPSSCVSLKSMDPPEHFKQESMADPREIAASVLIVDHFRCSVCAEVLRDPVSIPCGHSYCRQCISSYWAQSNHAGLYACPQCSHTYSSCPALYTNTALAAVVHKLQHFSPVPPSQCCAAPGDVACDVCTGRKLRAVKSCLTCMASYCETHLKEHYTIPVLQTHTLTECEHNDQNLLDIKFDIKTEELKQRKDKPRNQKLDIKNEEKEQERDSKTGVPHPQVVSTAVGPVVQAQSEHQQQTQQTTEDPGTQPQPSDPQDQLPAQDNVENQKNNSEKQDKSLGDNSQESAPEKDPKESRRLLIQHCIQSLVHACQCRNADCSLPSCQKMKRVVQHTKGCKRKTQSGGCPICKQLIALCCYHAKHCQVSKCPVPFCLNLKHKLRQQQLQHRLQQAQEQRRRMDSMRRAGQTVVPGPEGSTSPSIPIPSAQPAMPQIPKSFNNTLGHQPVMGAGSQAPQQQHPSSPLPGLQDLFRALRSPSQQQMVLNMLRSNPSLMAAFIKQRVYKPSLSVANKATQ